MLIEYICLLLLGSAAGVAAGLLPGLHVNNIGVLALPLLSVFDPIGFAIFLTAMATSQSFINFIPSIFLGVPDEDTVLSLLPTHRLLIEGRGMEAVRITAKACLYGTFLSLLLLPLAFLVVPFAYSSIRGVMAPVLIVMISTLVIRERKSEKILWALATVLISGYLGWVCLNLDTLSTTQVLLPMFSGLFGLSTLLTGLQTSSTAHKQELGCDTKISDRSLWRNSLLGAVGGLLVGLLPAMSPSQIGIFFQEVTALKERAKGSLEDARIREFITMVASLNAADAMFSIFAVYLMGNPRSGVSVMIQDIFGQIDLGLLALLAGVMLVSGLISFKIHLWLGERFTVLSSNIDFRKLSAGCIVFVIVMVVALSGFLGFLIMCVSTLIGLVPALAGVSRTHCMGCLLLPTLVFFLGL